MFSLFFESVCFLNRVSLNLTPKGVLCMSFHGFDFCYNNNDTNCSNKDDNNTDGTSDVIEISHCFIRTMRERDFLVFSENSKKERNAKGKN